MNAAHTTRGWCVALAFTALGCASPDTSRPEVRVEPRAFRIETVMFDVPLPIAEELYRQADANDSTLGCSIDEAHVRERLEALASASQGVERAERPVVTAAPGELAHVPDRVVAVADPVRKLESDGLALEVRASISYDFAPVELELRLTWRSANGAQLGRLPSSVIPMPAGAWLRVVCLPSRAQGGNAVLAFLHVTVR